MEEEDREVLKSINETPAHKAAKRRKLNEEAQEVEDLKKHLELILLVERRCPLLKFTLEQLVNVTRLQVEEESEMSLELLSSLKPYVPNVTLEKIIIDLEDEVVNILEKEKVNLEAIESLKSKSFESNEKIVQICLWIIDSGCSKHMTGNRAVLTNFVEKFLRTVRFGNNDFDGAEKVTGVNLFYLQTMNYETANVPYLLVHYLFHHAEGRKNGARLSRERFIGRLAAHFGLVGDQGLRAPVQAPHLPPIAPQARTMSQRIDRLEEEVHEMRQSVVGLRGVVESSITEQTRVGLSIAHDYPMRGVSDPGQAMQHLRSPSD
nr:integrase, catalytic region, zinc finger, CCHC-type, peptidase aspartic, catalytic [Tanacetum cinerariifolium]